MRRLCTFILVALFAQQALLAKGLDVRELKLSKRTVQTLRSTGRLPYTRFNHKTYYRLEDVMKVLEEHKALARKDREGHGE